VARYLITVRHVLAKQTLFAVTVVSGEFLTVHGNASRNDADVNRVNWGGDHLELDTRTPGMLGVKSTSTSTSAVTDPQASTQWTSGSLLPLVEAF
jgi:hypothetical protein